MKMAIELVLEGEKKIGLMLKAIQEDIESVLQTEPMEGIQIISKSPHCATVPYSMIASNNLILSPDYYLPHAQASAVMGRLRGVTRVTELISRIEEMIHSKEAVVGRNRTRLNPKTIGILQEYIS